MALGLEYGVALGRISNFAAIAPTFNHLLLLLEALTLLKFKSDCSGNGL
jgi:hypothetical protein